ncbi:hypothetical protein [Alkalihalobacillus sp. AL-G]|uniref:hypothetical protein n=1 Tax=Alkalihalobacillus sp. AL-G TaxID=2926399 RepID=UPI00272C7FA7|nr:hypothetical protein [Alkalihalobacillus sp. AL-G]WLD94440.1 hypothetical protein MOJ78_06000 [Alkalihalobacillus sp. AL-G]
MRYSNDPVFYIIPLLVLGTIFLVYALKQEKPIERFRWSAFVLFCYGIAVLGIFYEFTKNLIFSIVGFLIILVVHFLIFRTSEEFFNKDLKRGK